MIRMSMNFTWATKSIIHRKIKYLILRDIKFNIKLSAKSQSFLNQLQFLSLK